MYTRRKFIITPQSLAADDEDSDDDDSGSGAEAPSGNQKKVLKGRAKPGETVQQQEVDPKQEEVTCVVCKKDGPKQEDVARKTSTCVGCSTRDLLLADYFRTFMEELGDLSDSE